MTAGTTIDFFRKKAEDLKEEEKPVDASSKEVAPVSSTDDKINVKIDSKKPTDNESSEKKAADGVTSNLDLLKSKINETISSIKNNEKVRDFINTVRNPNQEGIIGALGAGGALAALGAIHNYSRPKNKRSIFTNPILLGLLGASGGYVGGQYLGKKVLNEVTPPPKKTEPKTLLEAGLYKGVNAAKGGIDKLFNSKDSGSSSFKATTKDTIDVGDNLEYSPDHYAGTVAAGGVAATSIAAGQARKKVLQKRFEQEFMHPELVKEREDVARIVEKARGRASKSLDRLSGEMVVDQHAIEEIAKAKTNLETDLSYAQREAERIPQYRNEIEEARKSVETAKSFKDVSKLRKAEDKIREIKAKLNEAIKAKRNIASFQKNISDADSEIKRLNREISNIKNEYSSANRALRDAKVEEARILDEQVRPADRIGSGRVPGRRNPKTGRTPNALTSNGKKVSLFGSNVELDPGAIKADVSKMSPRAAKAFKKGLKRIGKSKISSMGIKSKLAILALLGLDQARNYRLRKALEKLYTDSSK